MSDAPTRPGRPPAPAAAPLPPCPIQPWPIEHSVQRGHYKIFSVRELQTRSPKLDRVFPFYVIDSPTWVNVIPLTDDDQVVLIRQYRHGTLEITLEVPGGLVDAGEDPGAAALRELREETGCEAEELIDLGYIDPNPAIMSNRCYTFLARGARCVAPPELDGTEDIEVLTLPRSELNLRMARGEIRHSLVAVALYKLELYLQGLYG